MAGPSKRERFLILCELPILILAGILVPLCLAGGYAWWQTPGQTCDQPQVTTVDLYQKGEVGNKGQEDCVGDVLAASVVAGMMDSSSTTDSAQKFDKMALFDEESWDDACQLPKKACKSISIANSFMSFISIIGIPLALISLGIESKLVSDGYEQEKRLGVSLISLALAAVLLTMITVAIVLCVNLVPDRDFPFESELKTNVELIGTGYHIALVATFLLGLVVIVRMARVCVLLLLPEAEGPKEEDEAMFYDEEDG